MIDTRMVVKTIRNVLREQATMSYMPRPVVQYIFDNNLLKLTLWPGWVISLTPTGKHYLADHEKE